MNPNLLTARRERDRHLLYLSTPRLWPAYPFLPLVRAAAGGPECGLLFDLKGLFGLYGYGSTVFAGNLFALPPTLAAFLALPRHAYDSADEAYAAGWRLD